ncbi:MAG TPA: energy transducer TonB [bacterium]|nr:energy transducer TonB [bacterium]
MSRVLGVDARFLGAAALLHGLALGVGTLVIQPSQYGVAASSGSSPSQAAARPAQDSGDLHLDFSAQAWAAAPLKRPVPLKKPPQAPGTGETRESPGYLLNPHPPYPEESRRLGQQGTVYLRVDLDDRGNVKSVSLLKSSGFALLDESALQTVKDWKFTPFRLGGVAVPGTESLPIIFNLQDQAP